jgi:hypothetical protein
MGDGVLIYFGYPEAHEDDVEQSVRAGLGFGQRLEPGRKVGGLAEHSLLLRGALRLSLTTRHARGQLAGELVGGAVNAQRGHGESHWSKPKRTQRDQGDAQTNEPLL